MINTFASVAFTLMTLYSNRENVWTRWLIKTIYGDVRHHLRWQEYVTAVQSLEDYKDVTKDFCQVGTVTAMHRHVLDVFTEDVCQNVPSLADDIFKYYTDLLA